ncbi:unnamed protein product [Rotaria sp. Silwood2]|nr:unnamed protein product [Rotaria sp. Silwood2]CAF4426208.1 unnamed protein product [Rotaria sp. Silwood2]
MKVHLKVFNKASSLPVKKWSQREHDFLQYFENEWLQTFSTWYEEYNCFTPSTNNSLKATNIVIKDKYTLREGHPLSRFFVIANDIVRRWSKSWDPKQIDPIIYSSEPTITLKKWTDAYHFAKSSKLVLQTPSSRKDIIDYYIPAGEAQHITQHDIQKYQKKTWNSFDQFKILQFGIWKVTLSNDGTKWKSGTCNCPNFFKEFICKQVIGMAIRLEFCKPPSSAKDIALRQKRKRGRPRKATKALLTQ